MCVQCALHIYECKEGIISRQKSVIDVRWNAGRANGDGQTDLRPHSLHSYSHTGLPQTLGVVDDLILSGILKCIEQKVGVSFYENIISRYSRF